MVRFWRHIWDDYLIKVQSDKHYHFEISLIGAITLRRLGFSRKWTFIIVFSAGVLKECYDKWFGREKKFDWGDLLADFFGAIMGIILI